MGPRCSSAETQVCHRSYIIAASPMSVDRQQRNISTPQHEISFHRVQRLQCDIYA